MAYRRKRCEARLCLDRMKVGGSRVRSGGVAAFALFVAGCSHANESDLQRENAVLKAQIAMLDAQLQDCRASVHDMIDVKDIVGSGSGIDTENENDDSESDDNIMSIGPMDGRSLGDNAFTTDKRANATAR